jgi:hypothetical protein
MPTPSPRRCTWRLCAASNAARRCFSRCAFRPHVGPVRCQRRHTPPPPPPHTHLSYCLGEGAGAALLRGGRCFWCSRGMRQSPRAALVPGEGGTRPCRRVWASVCAFAGPCVSASHDGPAPDPIPITPAPWHAHSRGQSRAESAARGVRHGLCQRGAAPAGAHGVQRRVARKVRCQERGRTLRTNVCLRGGRRRCRRRRKHPPRARRVPCPRAAWTAKATHR